VEVGGRDTDGLLPDVVEGIRAGVDNLTLNLVCPTTVVPQAASCGRNVNVLGHAESLAVVEGLDGGEQIGILLEEIGKLHKELSAVLGCLLSPWAVEGLACSIDGDVDILLRGFLDRADDLLSRRVDDLKGLTVYGLDEFVVDEAGWVSNDARAGLPIIFGRGSYAYRPVGCSYSPVWGVLSWTDTMLYTLL
jgi:hypothetical protein